MCTLALAATAIGGVMNTYGTIEEGKSQSAAYEAQAKQDEANARTETFRQHQIANNAAYEAKKMLGERKLAEGSQAAAMGSAGIDMTQGSALDILSATLEEYGNDAMMALSNQRNANYDSRVRQTNFINSANANKAAAKNVKTQSYLSAAGTALGTAVSYSKLKKDWDASKSD